MDKAQQLRIKQQNMQQQHLARVITVTSGKVVLANPICQLTWQFS